VEKRRAEEARVRDTAARQIHQTGIRQGTVNEKIRNGIFINTSHRPDLKEIIEKLKAGTGIGFNADLV
jgi:hypothetical protein